MASAALSIRLATTRRISSGSAFTGGSEAARSVSRRDAVEAPAEKSERAFDDRIQIRRREPRGREARELRELVHQRFQRLHLALDQPRALGRQFFEFRALLPPGFAAAARSRYRSSRCAES